MSTIAIALINLFKDKILKAIDITKDELENFFNDGLHNYLETQRDKHQNVRTFIFREKSIDFDEVYFPVGLTNFRQKIDDSMIIDLIRQGKNISILGTAGSGKTMLVSKLFLYYLKNKEKIPIVIPLRVFNSYTGTFVEYIYDKILSNKVHPSEKILDRVLSSGDFIFFLDGYDEIYSLHTYNLQQQIHEFVEIFNKNHYVITSRPGTSIEYWSKFNTIKVEPLNIAQVESFINQQATLMGDNLFGRKIIETIGKPENIEYNEYFSNPLLLSMFIFTYKHYPELPKTKSKFYSYVWQTLCFTHDIVNKKEGHIQDRTSGLTTDEIEEVVEWFSFLALMEGQFTFEEDYLIKTLKTIKREINFSFETTKLIYDLRTSISILVLDGVEYKFPHKSIQEYFAALLISGFDDFHKNYVYQSYLPILQQRSEVGGILNFYKLCEELDKISFYKHFINYFLKILQESVAEGSNQEKLEILLDIYPLNIDFDLKRSTGDFEITSIEFQSPKKALYHEILNFLGIAKNFRNQISQIPSGNLTIESINNIHYRKLSDKSRDNVKNSKITYFTDYKSDNMRVTLHLRTFFDNNFFILYRDPGIVTLFQLMIDEINLKVEELDSLVQKDTIKIRNLIK